MTCKSTFKCTICFKNHETKTHKCKMCNEIKTYVHTSVTCNNCHDNHKTNNHVCETIKALKSKFQNISNGQWKYQSANYAKFSKSQICTT